MDPASRPGPAATRAVDADVVVVGAGPAGAAAALALADTGRRVTLVERRHFPRPSTCGDLLTPLAVAELGRLGLDPTALPGAHPVGRIAVRAGGHQLDRPWPTRPDAPGPALVLRREVLDTHLARLATERGATLLEGHDAVTPIVERGFVRGATVTDPDGRPRALRSRYLLVADGANSRFGRTLGTFRHRSWPYVTAIRGYWAVDPEPPTDGGDRGHRGDRGDRGDGASRDRVEVSLELTGRDGTELTGYGWVFPLGDGTANVGVGVWSTSREFRSVNTTELLGRHVAAVAERWGLDPGSPLAPPVSGRIPVGGSVGPIAGPAHLVVGDAAGAANPLTGVGVEYALATGHLAGEVLAEALEANDPTTLQRYPSAVAERWGTDAKVGRLVDRFAGHPAVVRRGGRLLVRHPRVADAALRIALGALRDRHLGGAELAHRTARAISLVAPAT